MGGECHATAAAVTWTKARPASADRAFESGHAEQLQELFNVRPTIGAPGSAVLRGLPRTIRVTRFNQISEQVLRST